MTENVQKTCNYIAQAAASLQEEEGASTLLVVNDDRSQEINIYENFDPDSKEIIETLEATIGNLFNVRDICPEDVVAFEQFVTDVCTQYISGHIACVKAG